jgi:GTP-binding protein Era
MKSGYVAIIGKPNVGKSTLLNRLLDVKLSIVSSKPQTTRHRVLGILTEGEYQCYFLDTPGLIVPQYELQKVMMDQIKRALDDADVILWMIDPWHKREDFTDDLVSLITEKVTICCINKVDLVAKSRILPIIAIIKEVHVQDIVPVSALTGDGIQDLKQVLFAHLPQGPFLYPSEDISDSPERFFVAEIVREQVFNQFSKEVPYASCVVIDDFKEREKGKDYIRAIIYVEKESQKGILIGKGGTALKKIGAHARAEIEKFLDRPVYLELWVKVKTNWRKDKKFLKELGY